MGMGGGLGDVIGGVMQMFDGEAAAEQVANRQQYERERKQAAVALQGAREKGAYEQGRQRILAERTLREQNVAYANSGIDATSGTAANVQANSAGLAELDSQTLAINAAREAWGIIETKRQSDDEFRNRYEASTRKQTGAILGGFSRYASGALSMGQGKGK